MRLVKVQEPIRVVHSARSRMPKSFTWRTRQHQVWKIDGFKQESIDRAQGLAKRRVYRVQTYSGLRCSLSYDEARNRWRIETISPKGVGG